MSNRHLLIISVVMFDGHISCTSLNSSRHSSLCGFVAFPCDASAAHPGQPPRRRIFWVQPLALFQPQSLAMVSPSFFVGCDILRQLQFWSHHLPRSSTQTFPVRRFPSITQCLSCPAFASHNSILGTAQNSSCSIMMTNEDTLRLANELTLSFSNFTKPNFLSKLRHWLSPSSTSSPHFTRLSVTTNSHLVHDLRGKTRKPTE